MSATETEIDMKDVELNEVDPERQPMNASNGDAGTPLSDKNGIVTVKIPEEKAVKFTGLSKEELLQVAGTPGWVRARYGLLILFWLGWVGMLAGAIVIIVQAPRCKPLPEINWWDKGPLYQIGDVKAFTNGAGLSDVTSKVDKLSELKIKGLVISPTFKSNPEKPEEINLKAISPEVGSETELKKLLQTAHRKSISVVLDLTPNYRKTDFWFANMSGTAEKVKSATDYWLSEGFDGVLLHDLDNVISKAPSVIGDLKDIVKNHSMEEQKALIGVTEISDPVKVGTMLNTTGVNLLLSGVLKTKSSIAEAVEHLYSQQGTKLAWNFGGRFMGHLASIVGPSLVKFNQMLLFTLPGTPVFNYGDEIGLLDQTLTNPVMVWDYEGENQTEKEMKTLRNFFKTLSDLRGKERSLLHGEYENLYNSTSALAFLRVWDQSERYIAAFNWSPEKVTLELTSSMLPEKATVVLSTTDSPAKDESLDLKSLKLEPHQGILLKFPYVA